VVGAVEAIYRGGVSKLVRPRNALVVLGLMVVAFVGMLLAPQGSPWAMLAFGAFLVVIVGAALMDWRLAPSAGGAGHRAQGFFGCSHLNTSRRGSASRRGPRRWREWGAGSC
jgi:hypothetical protein